MEYPVYVTCLECRYSQVVRKDSDQVPADYVVEHGLETGHTLTIERGADSADPARGERVE